MSEENDNERIDFDNKDYFDRSGCASIAAAMGIIALFWIVLGGIYLFT